LNYRTLMSALATLGIVVTATTVTAQELEPGVQTSSSAAAVKPAPPPAVKPAVKPNSEASGSPPASSASASPASTPSKVASGAPGSAKPADRIELGATQISGNRELPRVMYVVPWRRADPGDFAGRPPNSLLDEALTPVDRDVFRRQNSYYGAVRDPAQGAAPQSGAAGAAGSAATPKDEK
jgi:hypothetical protein